MRWGWRGGGGQDSQPLRVRLLILAVSRHSCGAPTRVVMVVGLWGAGADARVSCRQRMRTYGVGSEVRFYYFSHFY